MGPLDLDFEAITTEWLRVLRGKRSQVAFSRRLGYRSSVVHRWEKGVSWPTISRFLVACERCGSDLEAAYATFFQDAPRWLNGEKASSPAGVAHFLRRLRGKMEIGALAQASGYSRYSVARWLRAKAEPNVPQFFRLVEAASRRSLDFIATLQDPSELPSARAAWARLQALRRAAYEETWSHAVLRALELDEYLTAREPLSWVASVLGIGVSRVEQALNVLEGAGQVKRNDGRWIALASPAVTTGREPKMLGVLTRHWTNVALERLAAGDPTHFGYSLFSVSRVDLQRIRDLHLSYLREMQAIVAASRPNECVGLLCLHLLDLNPGTENALRSPEARKDKER